MLGHYDKIEAVCICGCNKFVKSSGRVAAEACVGVNYSFIFFESGISGGRSRLVQFPDLSGQSSDLVPPIDERRLYSHQDRQNYQKYPFDQPFHQISGSEFELAFVPVKPKGRAKVRALDASSLTLKIDRNDLLGDLLSESCNLLMLFVGRVSLQRQHVAIYCDQAGVE